jgi:ParB-like chromosome segregation protein Spo0J
MTDEISQVPIEDLIPYARNARTHSDEQVAQIAASIREFGFVNPVLLKDDNTIIAGHGRVLAARKLSMDAVPCIYLSHLSETQARAYIIADNKLALNAGWDEELLNLELGELADEGFDLDLTGFDVGFLKSLELEKQRGANDADEEWQGMPEHVADEPRFGFCVVSFATEQDREDFFRIMGQTHTEKTKSIWHPKKVEEAALGEFVDED